MVSFPRKCLYAAMGLSGLSYGYVKRVGDLHAQNECRFKVPPSTPKEGGDANLLPQSMYSVTNGTALMVFGTVTKEEAEKAIAAKTTGCASPNVLQPVVINGREDRVPLALFSSYFDKATPAGAHGEFQVALAVSTSSSETVKVHDTAYAFVEAGLQKDSGSLPLAVFNDTTPVVSYNKQVLGLVDTQQTSSSAANDKFIEYEEQLGFLRPHSILVHLSGDGETKQEVELVKISAHLPSAGRLPMPPRCIIEEMKTAVGGWGAFVKSALVGAEFQVFDVADDGNGGRVVRRDKFVSKVMCKKGVHRFHYDAPAGAKDGDSAKKPPTPAFLNVCKLNEDVFPYMKSFEPEAVGYYEDMQCVYLPGPVVGGKK